MTREALNRALKAHEDTTGNQIAVLTVKTIPILLIHLSAYRHNFGMLVQIRHDLAQGKKAQMFGIDHFHGLAEELEVFGIVQGHPVIRAPDGRVGLDRLDLVLT